jgi:hypothetical protein
MLQILDGLTKAPKDVHVFEVSDTDRQAIEMNVAKRDLYLQALGPIDTGDTERIWLIVGKSDACVDTFVEMLGERRLEKRESGCLSARSIGLVAMCAATATWTSLAFT